MVRTACTEPQCLYNGTLYHYLTVELYLYSPYGPYGLYRASVSVQRCTLSLRMFKKWLFIRSRGPIGTTIIHFHCAGFLAQLVCRYSAYRQIPYVERTCTWMVMFTVALGRILSQTVVFHPSNSPLIKNICFDILTSIPNNCHCPLLQCSPITISNPGFLLI
jgi:hypothetical protein